MATKYDIPDTYLNEYTKYQELFLLGSSGRGAIGAGSFLSTTSSVTYTYTDGNDLFSQLNTAIGDYLVTASDFNAKLEQSDFLNIKRTISMGGMI